MACVFSDGDVASIVALFSFVPFLLSEQKKMNNKIIYCIPQSFLE